MIHYLKGDATKPVIKKGKRIIAHIVNDMGAWGKGFVLAIDMLSPEPQIYYKDQFKKWKKDPKKNLGQVHWIFVDIDLVVCNMVAQHGLYHSEKNPVPLAYDALKKCLHSLYEGAQAIKDEDGVSIHMPKIGCGLARGDWNIVSKMIEDKFKKMDVYVYELD